MPLPQKLTQQATRIANALERLLPAEQTAQPDIHSAKALRWHHTETCRWLEPVPDPDPITLAELHCIDRQKALLTRNIAQFVQGLPANNMLLWGPRGTGKSSLVKALLNDWWQQGLKLVEVEKSHLHELPDISACLRGKDGAFLLYCDDLGFCADDPGYRGIKTALDGSLLSLPDNVLICATSNRRHLLPELLSENRDSALLDGELHHSDAVEEKISLSERFGLWVAFHPFNQEQYLDIVAAWLERLGNAPLDDAAREAALRWALERGSRSGRCAQQFARDWVGQQGLAAASKNPC